MKKALEGTIVLDLGQIYNGPYCSLMLAFQGAKVIKIEPINGENLRVRRKGDCHELLMLNSNKLGVSLDLKSEEGKEIFLELVKRADVVVENFSLGAMERLGLGYDVLSTINPRIIYASGKGYGLEGPYANRPAMDLTIQAMGGVMATTGFADKPPVKAGPALCDFLGGIHLFGGIATALYQREKTGKGQLVEVSMHDTIYPTLASALGAYYSQGGKVSQRTGNQHSGMATAPYNVYPTEDGYIAILCVADRQWKSLLKVMEKEELLNDERFQTNIDRSANTYIVDEIVTNWTSNRKKLDIADMLIKANVPHAPVQSIAEVAEDPHLTYRGMIREIEHPKEGKIKVPGSPIRLSDSPLTEVFAAPMIGEHTDEVLQDLLGLTEGKLEELRDKNIIRSKEKMTQEK
ncbi:CaiB/BaiF CoA transferase family protein [Metabacillus sediminilitoris]|uniref:CoA transferase n=1 Tax=Metabacillus sediminilitoris TaxID=2567941 RepID=A0A4S4BQK7_9BACI|nr:CoA transferase [Metabacillus sediminilitoris]QGQ45648.1 CoA transferase [Metabacillus sediminilitoris]THF77233.1 CoA transferase [Metabacillus sediminilitoris]